MKLYAIRHTSVAVKPGICYGQSDVDVAESFHEERKAVKLELSGLQFDKIFSSPLQRCRKLAEHLFPNQPILFDNRLKELNFGDWELKSWDEIYHSPEGKNWMDDYQNLSTLNGESYPQMLGRIAEWLNELKVTEMDKSVVVIHAGVIRILKHLIEGQPMDDLFALFKPPYGSVTIFDLKEINGK
ncbi:alpha-ribazole phosphatase [Maribellus sp. YY47]|uniref:alpha-ribazole phosphatase n=1 Tax=Maribellus sp. YY47 TaxID=2929486 RepID=UPI002000CEAD|nr:alpha-ribazole phosphatase [Maribellus sp. YY47]MCK3685236.1 alpha-ribazole phosphatase [Maribellus sp. YY47]